MKRQSSGFALQNRNGSGLRVLAEEAEECNACCQIKEKRFTTSLALSLSLSLSLSADTSRGSRIVYYIQIPIMITELHKTQFLA